MTMLAMGLISTSLRTSQPVKAGHAMTKLLDPGTVSVCRLNGARSLSYAHLFRAGTLVVGHNAPYIVSTVKHGSEVTSSLT